jgi:hypothetical protein
MINARKNGKNFIVADFYINNEFMTRKLTNEEIENCGSIQEYNDFIEYRKTEEYKTACDAYKLSSNDELESNI